MTIDPRLAERRRVVAEDRAKRSVRRLLRFLGLVGVVALVVWFAFSPYMSASTVAVEGASMAAVDTILAEEAVVVGRPLILIRPGMVAEALKADPWVADATVQRIWPDRVEVAVVERVPRAWVETADGWARRDEYGVALPSAAEPDRTLGWIRLPRTGDDAATGSNAVVGSVEFLMALPEETARHATIRTEDGELWATVDGWEVRLGRADEMREKALSLVTLLQQDLDEGSLIVLIAPTHPSVLPPSSSDSDEATNGGDGASADEESPESEEQG